MTAREVLLDGGSPWGFRMNGGADVGHALRISRVNPGSKAAQRGVREGDVITSINGQPTKCLTNGESHVLLRTVGDTLRLGLNQDTSGSPKRRNKEPLKREASGSSSVSTPSTPVPVETAPAAAPEATTPTSPSEHSESTSAGAKVFVRGIWNSVSKTKQRGKNGDNQVKPEEKIQGSSEMKTPADSAVKASSSKARRLRKLKLKSSKRGEQTAGLDNSPELRGNELGEKSCEEEGRSVSAEAGEVDNIELVIVMDEEDVRRAGGVVSENEQYFTESVLNSIENTEKVLEETEDDISKATKSKTKKKNGKSKGFSLSQIFTTKVDKNENSIDDSKFKIIEKVNSPSSNDTLENPLIEDNTSDEPVKIIPTTISEHVSDIVEDIPAENTNKIINRQSLPEIHLDNSVNKTNTPQNILPNVTIKDTPILNSSTIFTIVESQTIPSKTTKTESGVEKLTSSALKISKIVMMSSDETANTLDSQNESFKSTSLNSDALKGEDDISSKSDKVSDEPLSEETSNKGSRPISIFVVPPDNVAEEAEAPGVDWESVSDFDTKSQIVPLDDDVRPETLIHLPSNDLQSSAVIKDGRNGIVQVDDYDLSVQDLSSPLIEPEEEARLRSFLETLNLTKPEEYDDTSSSKSYGDSSSTSISESSPIPPPPSDEIVVYRQMKSHSVAESCYIPPRLQRQLDVITEETSDPSDSEKKNGMRQPWENSELIRKNNEMDQIPNDWYGSDEEPETTSDEGGIDTSWRDGKKLEDVEGVEVVYLSEDSDDEESSCKTAEDNNYSDLNNKHNLPELVVVHAVDQQDVKKVVKIQQPAEQKDKTESDDLKVKKSAMDEIMAILDSTYEINKDLFIKQSSAENLDKSKLRYRNIIDSVTRNEVSKTEKVELQPKFSEFKHIVEDPMSIYTTKSEPLTILDIFDSGKYESHRNPLEEKHYENSFDEVPVAQEVLLAMTPPTLSRQGSSSSATSQSTAKYNPGQSPMSSEAEDKSEIESNHKKKSTKRLYNPKSLTNLSIDVVTCLPHGDFYLKKIGFFGGDIVETEHNENHKEITTNGKLTSLPPSGISTRHSSFHELDSINSYQNCDSDIEREPSPPRPVLLTSPPPSSLMSPPPNDDPWVGLPTSTDPRLLVCLSPSQSKDTTMTTPQEATELLELHKKFVERRGYHEGSKRNSICSPKSERSCTPDFSSPDLIRLEPYESKKAQVYTPELLIEAANLLALKEYRQSRFKSGTQSNCFKTPEATVVKIDDIVLEKNDGLSDVTSPRPEIAADSGGSNRSAGTSRLLALLQDGGVRCASSSPNNTVPSEMDRVDKSVGRKIDSVHRYSGSYISEWLTMSENVKSNSDFSKTDVNKNVINLNNSAGNSVAKSDNDLSNENRFERRHFEAEKYKISKQGDIAIIQTPEDGEKQQPLRNERPKSMPAVGVPALTPSGGELFREQMYQEYMNKVAERTERRQQKVIKISSRPTSVHSSKVEEEVEKSSQNPPANKLESEFIVKARERMSKLGINLDEEAKEEQSEEKPAEKELPKHLQEFMELTTAPLADGTRDIGVWSPGATPEAQRKEFNFSAVKEEVVQEDTEEVPPVWTPKSAHASPTSERKTFRPVNFESPKLSRKTYNQRPSEEVPKPPTDLPLQLDSPSHSQTSSVSSSTQYLSSTRETHSTTQHTSSSTTQESSAGRLVSSHSLPDTSLLPRAQNPTITLLQKAREGQLPRGAHYLDQNSNNTEDKRSSPPAVRPNEVLYSIRREYESESEDKRPKKIVDLGPRKFDGIGPTTKEGIPIVLRSEVQDENQQKWYKRMYDSLHRAERDKEYVTVRYKTRRGRYPYTSPGGYLSEPEPLGSYDSDYASAKYATLDRRRIRNKENDFTTSTMPRSKYNAVKHAVDVYKNQPGRIEDYEPGHSSIADKETKQWWDEVMDIFDGQFEQTQKSSPRTQAPATSTNKPFMTYALKESGYESDSTLVFKRRDETQQQLSPAEQKLAYKAIQKGGDVPLHGLRKPVPEKPKESPHRYVESEVTIHYRSPVRSEEKEEWSEAELQRRQAEAMRRIYQEERRRKYLQELQDMYSRRHTDNFTPSQKSPIPLNRYDDFVDDLSPGKPRDRTPEPKLVARALYNFIGQTSRELTFRRGDIIYVRRQIDKNWYEGEHNAMIGLFPFNYVEIIPYDGIRTIPKRPTEGQARAKFNFQAQTHLELPLVKGELVLLTRRVDNNWFEGRIGTRKGIFPVSYVEVLVEPGERALSPVRVNTPTKPVASPAAHSLHTSNNMSQHHYQPPRPVSYTSLPRQKTADLKQPPVNQTLHIDTQNEPVPYRVLYNYKPQNEDELELIEGETVYVMEKCDDGWYVGSSQRTGYLGTFPGNYVERQV